VRVAAAPAALEVFTLDGVTLVGAVQTTYVVLLQRAAEKDHDTSSLRLCVSGSLPVEVHAVPQKPDATAEGCLARLAGLRIRGS
jgi:acyl-CoA synthetase (AMP-forming)/AMP-acid ligase II